MIGFAGAYRAGRTSRAGELQRLPFATAIKAAVVVAAVASFAPGSASAAADTDIKRLEKIILEQQKRIESQERRLLLLERRRAPPHGAASFADVIPRKGATRLSTRDLSVLRGGMVTRAGIQIIMPDGNVYTVPFVLATMGGKKVAQVAPQAPVEVPEGGAPRAPVEVPEDKSKTRKDPRAPVPPEGPKKEVKKSPEGQPPGPQPRPPTAPNGEGVRPKSEKPLEQLLLARGGILLPSGTFQIEPGVEFTRFSNSRVAISGVSIFEAIIIGLIRVDALDRDIISGQLKARLGIIKRLQVDTSVSYIYRRDLEVLGVGTPDVAERVVTGMGIGDIEFGVTGQPVIGGDGIPDILVRANIIIPTGESPFDIPTEMVEGTNEARLVRVPTGSGFYSAGATATFVWTSDPVVFFTGAGYQMNFQKRFEGFGKVNPGNSIQFFAGMNLAVSDKVSLSFSFVNQRTFSTKANGVTAPGTSFSDSRLTLGASVGVAKNTNVLVSASVGLGEQSPDFVFSVRIPMTFQLWE